MKCPVCVESNLLMTDRSGVEVDYCPRCRGVWLDRGELDKLIERSVAQVAAGGPVVGAGPVQPPAGQQPPMYPQQGYRRRDDDDDDDDDDRRRYQQPPAGGYQQPPAGPYQQPYKKRKSWLGEILDFD